MAAPASRAAFNAGGPLLTQLRRWGFSLSGFNKLGLYSHDILTETPDVLEAVRRLPNDAYDERQWRISRAFQLDLSHTILPKEDWTKFEDDWVNGRYLRQLMEQVEFERKERELWDSK